MTKLKCWKKVRNDMWEKKDNSVVRILDTKHFTLDTKYFGRPKKKAFVVYASKKGGYFGNPYRKAFTPKSQALAFANKYMKSHDKC